MLNIGQAVEVGFNAMPESERLRLVGARSTGRGTTAIYESKVDQVQHQKTPHKGVIEGVGVDKYLVRVFLDDSRKGRLREYSIDSPLIEAI